MRLLQITIPDGERRAVTRTLDGAEFDYFVSDETGSDEYDGIAYVPLPTEAVGPLLDALYDDGLSRDDHVVVIDAETDASRKFEKHEGEFRDEASGHVRIDDAQLRTKAKDMLLDFRTYLVMTVISAVVATSGVLLGSAAVVVGSMVIAPLIGPALGVAVGTVLDDGRLFRRSAIRQALGVVAAVASAAVFAWLVKVTNLLPTVTDVTAIGQVSGRLTPDFLSLIVALGAGVAGVLSIATGSSVALVGVMIAAALIPPAAIVGIGVAWGLPSVAVSSGILVLVNVLSVNVAALAVFWYLGYRPESVLADRSRWKVAKRGGLLLAAILVLSAFLAGVTLASVQQARVRETARSEVERILDGPAYDGIRLRDVSVQKHREGLFRDVEGVTVTLARPLGRRYPGLASDVRQNVTGRVTENVSVDIRYVLVAPDPRRTSPSTAVTGARGERGGVLRVERDGRRALRRGDRRHHSRASLLEAAV